MSREIPFWKLESVGNDFPLVHAGVVQEAQEPKLSLAMCGRRFGVGGDGLLVLEPGNPLRLRMYNPDGTPDFCGNGIRCAALHAHEVGLVGNDFTVEHGEQLVSVSIGSDGSISTVLEPASYSPERVPLSTGAREIFQAPIYWDESRQIFGSALTTGSTHVIIPVQSLPSNFELAELGPLIEHFHLYPIGTSVIWAETVAVDHLTIMIWERGVGETLGCGTGSSAAVANYLRSNGRVGRVRVDNPGGTIWVEAESWDSEITVWGKARTIFEGAFLIG